MGEISFTNRKKRKKETWPVRTELNVQRRKKKEIHILSFPLKEYEQMKKNKSHGQNYYER